MVRAEFAVGDDFVAANGTRSFWLFTLARLGVLPLGLIRAISRTSVLPAFDGVEAANVFDDGIDSVRRGRFNGSKEWKRSLPIAWNRAKRPFFVSVVCLCLKGQRLGHGRRNELCST